MGNLTSYNFTAEAEPLPVDQQIRLAMSAANIDCPQSIIMDGQIHRFPTRQNGGDDAGWYVFFNDGIPAGRFGDWRSGIEQTWRADVGRQLSPAEEMALKRREAEARAARDRATAERRAAAAESAETIWTSCGAASEDHPYLARKGIKPNGARVDGSGRLVVPLFDEHGKLSSIQMIADDGTKRYHKDGQTGGMYHVMGEINDTIYVAEGFATAATIFETVGIATVAAYSANNLAPVVGKLRVKYPTAQIIIVADNDKTRTGQNYAEQASAKHGAQVILIPQEGDANDYRQAGYDLKSLLTPKKSDWLVNADEWSVQPSPIEWLVKGWLQARALIMVHGPSGGGKTFVVLDWCLHIASLLVSWHGIKSKPGTVVYLAGEGHHGLRGRIAAWKQLHGHKPVNMYLSRSGCDLNEPGPLQEVIRNIRQLPEKPVLIVVDTLHRFLSGDENNSVDVKGMLDACALLEREFECSVLLVHHTGVSEDAQHRARGSSAWRGALDIEISIRPEGEHGVIIEQKKSKDAEESPAIYMERESVEIDGWFDEDGDQVKSAVMSMTDAPQAKKVDAKLSRHIASIRGAWGSSGREVVNGNPYVSKSAWIDYMVTKEDKSEATAKGNTKKSFARGSACVLYEKGIIQEHLHGYIVTDESTASAMLITLEKP